MHLRRGEHEQSADRRYQADLRIEFQRLFGVRLLARIRLDLCCGGLATLTVPLVVVVLARAVANGVTPVPGGKSHRGVGGDFLDRQPPGYLAPPRLNTP